MTSDTIVARFRQTTRELLDYQIDWTLSDGDTIASAQWIVPTGMTLGADERGPITTATSTRAWLSSSTPGTYVVSCVVTTTEGRTIERRLQLTVA